jgi:choline-glycine betaine transporter
MRNGTNKKKTVAPILCAGAVLLMLMVVLALMAYPFFAARMEEQLVLMLLFGLYSLMIVAMIVGVLMALCQRLREIRGGEEEDAKKY